MPSKVTFYALAEAEKFIPEHKWQVVFTALHHPKNVMDAEIPLPEILGRNSPTSA